MEANLFELKLRFTSDETKILRSLCHNSASNPRMNRFHAQRIYTALPPKIEEMPVNGGDLKNRCKEIRIA